MAKPSLLGRLAEISAPWRYAAAVGIAALSVALRWFTVPLLGSSAPYLWLFPAVLVVAILLGQGPGLLASAVGSLPLERWFVPRVSGAVISVEDCARMAVVMSSAILVGEIGRRLREAQAALVESDRRKDEFLAVLSHELRNPLGTIRSALTILDRGASFGRDADTARSTIERQLAHLSRLVDDLLDVSRIKTGKIRIERRPVDLCDLVRRTVEDHISLLSANDLVVDLRLPHAPVRVNGDPTRLTQILGNLLQNASKFTPPGGRVFVALDADGASARLRVRDNGLGLDDEVRHRLFEPFAQADSTLHRTRGGLGIGLALVQALVHLHQGQVEAISDGPGKGSEFAVTLPLEAGRAPAPARHDEVAEMLAQKKRILIIEDNRDFAAMLQVLLQLAGGHEVHLADSGPKGVDLARRVFPDVIICDIGLPVMDGYEVARALRSQAATRDALLIALTGYASLEDAKRAEDAGFDYHVAKGGDPEAVVHLLQQRPSQVHPS